MTGLTDQELVVRLKRFDTAAFDEVFDRYRPRLFGFLVRLCGNRDLAEDLLQETWLRLAAKVSTLRDDAKLSSWLFTVARNLHSSHRRSRMLTATRVLEFFRSGGSSGGFASPFEAFAREEGERRLEYAIASLPVRYREVLLLIAEDGLNTSEAASVCGLNQAALRKRLSRAREMLARRLREPAHGPVAEAESCSSAAAIRRRGNLMI